MRHRRRRMYHDLYEKIQKCCGYITVFLDGEVISEGTGFAFTPDGEVITAAHVVTGRLPIRVKDYTDPDTKIFVKFPGRELLEYRVAFCGFGIKSTAFTEAVQLDIASLCPREKQDPNFSYLTATMTPPRLGQEVFLAGYSEELSLPFNLDRILDRSVPGVEAFHSAMQKGYMADMMGPLIKRSIVGNHRRIYAEDSVQAITIEVDIFYLDNGMHSGASGGPIVNKSGEVIGLITQRAVTSASQSSDPGIKVPSGATVGLSLQPMGVVSEMMLRKHNKQIKPTQ